MSDNTICNYCRLQSIRRDTKNKYKNTIKKKRVVVVPAGYNDGLGGFNVHILDKRFEKPTAKNKVCWFWKITKVCAC